MTKINSVFQILLNEPSESKENVFNENSYRLQTTIDINRIPKYIGIDL